MLRCVNNGVMTIEPRHQTTGKVRVIWSDESSFTLFPTSGRTPRGLQSGMAGLKSQTWGRFCDGLGSNIVVLYSVGPITTLNG
jgi:hypothetical protein